MLRVCMVELEPGTSSFTVQCFNSLYYGSPVNVWTGNEAGGSSIHVPCPFLHLFLTPSPLSLLLPPFTLPPALLTSSSFSSFPPSLFFHLCQVGKQFDALLVDTKAPNPPVFDIFDQDKLDVSESCIAA